MNNKGMTLVEIIVSVTLVSIILIFMLNMLLTVKQYNDSNQTSSSLLINQSLIIREAQKDINDYKLLKVEKCTKSDINMSGINKPVPDGASYVYCLKLTFDSNLISDNIGYLVQYNYGYSSSLNKSVVGYKRGTNQVVRESPVLMDPSSNEGSVVSSCKGNTNNNCSLKITLPVIGNDDNHYDIELTYIYERSSFTCISASNSYGFDISC